MSSVVCSLNISLRNAGLFFLGTSVLSMHRIRDMMGKRVSEKLERKETAKDPEAARKKARVQAPP